MSSALVARTIGTSVVDGPGNRFVVFLQGCNFNCVNCHNPSTIRRMHRSTPEDIERGIMGIVDQLRTRAPFLSGVTVSGGEPTLHLEFLETLFETIKTDPALNRLSTFVDSNGSLDTAGWMRLIPWIDGVMLDLKAFTPVTHRMITGQTNARVLESIRFLSERERLAEIRLLVIEGLTDLDEELRHYARFVGRVNPAIRVKLMAYRHHGVRPQGLKWPETRPETISRVAAVLEREGLTNVAVPI